MFEKHLVNEGNEVEETPSWRNARSDGKRARSCESGFDSRLLCSSRWWWRLTSWYFPSRPPSLHSMRRSQGGLGEGGGEGREGGGSDSKLALSPDPALLPLRLFLFFLPSLGVFSWRHGGVVWTPTTQNVKIVFGTTSRKPAGLCQ